MILDSSLKLKINSVKIISFDIFDTLLLRSFLEPKDVFLALEKAENCPEFFKYRSEAEPKAWEKLGLDGIEECDHYLTAGETLLDGNVGFFMAPTKHFLSRHAWNNYMEFMRRHLNK